MKKIGPKDARIRVPWESRPEELYAAWMRGDRFRTAYRLIHRIGKNGKISTRRLEYVLWQEKAKNLGLDYVHFVATIPERPERIGFLLCIKA